MKKTIIMLVVTAALLGLSSCRETIVQEVDATKWKIVDIDVPANSWQEFTDQDGLNRYYMATVDVPEITEKVFKDGAANCYYVDGDVQAVLPYNRHYENVDGNHWTTTTDYEFLIGRVNFFVTSNDFAAEAPNAMKFRLVLLW